MLPLMSSRFNISEKTHRFSLSLIFGVFIFAVLLIATAFSVFAVWLLGKLGVITGSIEDSSIGFIVMLMSVKHYYRRGHELCARLDTAEARKRAYKPYEQTGGGGFFNAS